jgi:protein-arginine kinase activator protein McsA
MNKFVCDVCGKDTNLNPKVEIVPGETEVIKTQDYRTGEVVEQKAQKLKDLELRCHIVRLSAGQFQAIQKDFCTECIEQVMPEIKSLWNKLESIRSK